MVKLLGQFQRITVANVMSNEVQRDYEIFKKKMELRFDEVHMIRIQYEADVAQ